MSDIFHTIILTARPAAGKSEVIDFLKKLDPERRKKEFHVGEIVEIDDFPYIWEKFEEDKILEEAGRERLWTDKKLYFKEEWAWDFFLLKMNVAFAKHVAGGDAGKTVLFEFARGGKNGIRHALDVVSADVLKKAGILYIQVSYEESVRKNRRRFKPELAHSILYHSLPDEKMEFYYKDNDWKEITTEMQGAIKPQNISVPFSVLVNEPEVTDDFKKLEPALKESLDKLWKLYRK
ncbi:hypothetical protein EHM69_07730 [candidate division KSB1 bacterium]|nr:MAG: hypothetical protein EHM69_07730 [candidate division KSB1 bacterium]